MKQGSIIPDNNTNHSTTLQDPLDFIGSSPQLNQSKNPKQKPSQMQQNPQYSQVKLSQQTNNQQQTTTDTKGIISQHPNSSSSDPNPQQNTNQNFSLQPQHPSSQQQSSQKQQQTDTLITTTQNMTPTQANSKNNKNSASLMTINKQQMGQSTEPTMYTTKDVGDNSSIQHPVVTTKQQSTTINKQGGASQNIGKSQSQLQQYDRQHQPVVVGNSTSSVSGLGGNSSQQNVLKQAQSTSKKDNQQQNSPKDLDKIQSLIHYKQNLNSHNHTPNQQQNQFKSSSQPNGKNQNNIFQQHAASMKNLIDPIQLHTVTEEIHHIGGNGQNQQASLVLQVQDHQSSKFGGHSGVIKNANTSSSGQVINKRNSNIQQHTASSQHIFNQGQNQSSDNPQLQIQSQNSQQQQNMKKQNAYQMLNQRQLERQMMIQQQSKQSGKDKNSKLDSSNIINSNNLTQYDPKSIQSTTINSTSKQNSDPQQTQGGGLVKNRNWEIKQRSNLISADASRHLYQTFQKMGGAPGQNSNTQNQQQNQNNTSFNHNRNSINNQNLSSYNNQQPNLQAMYQNTKDAPNQNIIERSANNRESLQSRLLERITTKKNRSPQEIYLEEELSSEDEDDEYNQQKKIINSDTKQQQQAVNVMESDPKSQYYSDITNGTTKNVSKKNEMEKKGVQNSEQKRDEISTERRKTPTEDDMYGDIEDMIETERNTKTNQEKLKMQMMRKSKYGQMQGSSNNQGKSSKQKNSQQSCNSSSEGSNENTNIAANTDQQNGANSYEQRKASRKSKNRKQLSIGSNQQLNQQTKNDSTLRQSHQKNPKDTQQSLQSKDLKKRKKSSDRHHQQASNTHYGTKFYEFRNTLQNFNNKSNNALNNIMHHNQQDKKEGNESSTKIVISGSKQITGNVLKGADQLSSLQEQSNKQEQSNDYHDHHETQESGKVNIKSKESSFVEGGQQQILSQPKNKKQLKSNNDSNVYTASWNNNATGSGGGAANEINQNHHQIQSYGHHYNQQQFNMGGSSGNWRKVAMTQNNFYDPRNEGSRGPAIRNNQSHSNDTKRFTHNQNPNMLQQQMYQQNQNSQQYQQKSPFQNYGAVNSSNNNQGKAQYGGGQGYFSKAHAQVGNSSSQAYGYSQNSNAGQMMSSGGATSGSGNHKNQVLHQQHQQASFNQKQNTYFQQSPHNSKSGGSNLNTSNFGRKTFYVSDQQQKNKLEYMQGGSMPGGGVGGNNQNLGNIPIKNARAGPGNNLPHNQMVDYYNQHGGNQYAAHPLYNNNHHHQQVPSSQNPNMLLDQHTHFNKPRALSRQADAHIKIEVHRDSTIRNHLIAEKEEGMNLMFYDFNLSSVGGNTRQGGDRVKNSGQGGTQQANAGNAAQQMTCTAQNFYRQGNKGERMYYNNNKQGGVDGDRVPTRERGYRSAQQNFRKHHQNQQQQQYQQYQQQQQQYFNNQQSQQQTGNKQYINQPIGGGQNQKVVTTQQSKSKAGQGAAGTSSKIVVNNGTPSNNVVVQNEDVV